MPPLSPLNRLVAALGLCMAVAMRCSGAEPMTDAEKNTLREAHEAYAQAIAERQAYPNHIESSFAIAMQKHQEADSLAMKIGLAGKADAVPFLLDLKDQAFLRSFANTFRRPATPEIEALLLRHLQDPSLHPPEMSADIWALVHPYHTRALFDAFLARIKAELDTPQDPNNFFSMMQGANVGYLAAAIVRTDQPGIEAELTAILPQLDPYGAEPVARFLAERHYQPAEPALIDLVRRTPEGLRARNAQAVLALGSQAVLDAVAQQTVAVSRLPHTPLYMNQSVEDLLRVRNKEIEDLLNAIEVSPPWVRLDRKLLAGKALQGFTPEQLGKIAAMIEARDRVEKIAADVTPDNFTHWLSFPSGMYYDMVRSFIKRGIDVNAANKSGEQPVNVAAHFSNVEAMRLLLEAGADPDGKSADGVPPLRILAGHKSAFDANDEPTLATAKLLIAKGAHVSAAPPDGWTPLHLAAVANFRKMAELLVESGANVNAEAFERMGITTAPGLYGLTPLQLAEDQGATELAAYLRSKGATVNHVFAAKRAARNAEGALIAPFLWHSH